MQKKDANYSVFEKGLNDIIAIYLNKKYCEMKDLSRLDIKEMPDLLIECLGKMIRYNTNLQSLNLDNTGLNSHVLVGFVPFLRHSKSLLCFHLAQNPGITSTVKEFWQRRLYTRKRDHDLVIDVKRDRDDLKKPLDPEERLTMTENEIKIRDYKVANYRRWLMEEAATI